MREETAKGARKVTWVWMEAGREGLKKSTINTERQRKERKAVRTEKGPTGRRPDHPAFINTSLSLSLSLHPSIQSYVPRFTT
jgi:hypothetical protein